MQTTIRIFGYALLLFLSSWAKAQKPQQKNRPQKSTVWTAEKANAWYGRHPWITGANYLPANAINQLEMWQAETFDSAQIAKEMRWAQSIGFNTMRVFLHSVAWKSDPKGFKARMNTFLSVAGRHGVKAMFVFFDDCWNKEGRPGKQPEPKPGIHNSGWVQDPGQPHSNDTTLFPGLERYVKDVLTTFGQDERILMWDLYNEPGNSGKGDSSLLLLSKVFTWAREAAPAQPITAGLWRWDFEKLNAFQVANSDIITYHNYEEPAWHQRVIDLLKIEGKPLVCTEYMARTRNSRFENVLPLLKEENVGAINWGFVAGKSNTIYAWDTPLPDGSEPKEWFHDIFRPDGTPYREAETNPIKKLNSAK